MRKTSFLGLVTAIIVIFCLTFTFSCSSDKTGRHELSKNMLSDFSAEIDFLLDFDGNPLAGTATVTKNDKLRLDVHSPDPYSGISVECDVNGKSNVISLSFSGIKAEVPKAAMEKLVFLMNMLSENTANYLEKQNGKSFKPCEEMYLSELLPETVPYEVRFSCDGANYIYVYDSVTGIPLEIFADNEYCKAEIKIRKLNTEFSVSEE